MKSAGLKEIKTELKLLQHSKLVDVCMRLSKYKKENKELLTYLLFESANEKNYIEEAKLQIDEDFKNLNQSAIYLAKKTIRKTLRTTNKYIKYSGIKQTEVELLLHFCYRLKNCGVSLKSNTVLGNLYERQLIRMNSALESLHEDLQFDYNQEINKLLML